MFLSPLTLVRRSTTARRVSPFHTRLQVEVLEDRLAPAVITVNSAANTIQKDGEVTLAEAIESANKNDHVNADLLGKDENGDPLFEGTYGADTIKFALPGEGPHTISLTTADLPDITDPLTIDGYSQQGARKNTWASGTNALLQIILDGEGARKYLLIINANEVTIRGLVFVNSAGTSILVGEHTDVRIQGNFIGTDVTGFRSGGGKQKEGIVLEHSSQVTIGGPNPQDRNLISGNGAAGIEINAESHHNVIAGNIIGTDRTGLIPLPNEGDGITINGGSSNTIGGLAAGSGNLIAGNNGWGVQVDGFNARLNRILGNYIGIARGGLFSLPNNGGVYIHDGSWNDVGSSAQGGRNVISGNRGLGIEISGETATRNSIVNNYIGLAPNGTTVLANTAGVGISGNAHHNLIGGIRENEGNVISGNQEEGVYIKDSDENRIRGNRVGTDANGTEAKGNGGYGIQIYGGRGNRIGGTQERARNIISGNGWNARTEPIPGGIRIVKGASNEIKGNYIGLDVTGLKAIGNLGDGISVEGSAVNTVIGGALAGEENVISGNKGYGVDDRFGVNTKDTDNIFGKDKDRNKILRNDKGDFKTSSTGSRHEGVTMAFNNANGLTILAGTGHPITHVSITGTGGLGIDLGGDGRTANDNMDADTGPNNLQNFPVLTSASVLGATTTISGTLNSEVGKRYTIEFYGNDVASAEDAQGEVYLGSIVTDPTDSSGNVSFTVTLPRAYGTFVTATATDPDGNTSEFSDAISSGTPSPDPYAAPPTVTHVDSPSGSTLGGTVVNLVGTHFAGASAVHFGSIAGTLLELWSDTAMTVLAPPGSAGTVHITVTTPEGTSSTTSSDEFTYSAPSGPAVSTVSPSSGGTGGGTLVTLTGTGFTRATDVLFGDKPAD